jgi:chromosome segregation ATPase
MDQENSANAEDAATESESDEENARPARRFQAGNAVAGPSRLAAGAENIDGNNSELEAFRAQLKDLRDAQRTSREKIARLEHELAVQSAREEEETREYQQQLSEAQDERHAADQRVRQVNDAMKEEKEISKKLKEDKKGLTKSLKMEVEKVTKFREQVSRLTSELSKLKECAFRSFYRMGNKQG